MRHKLVVMLTTGYARVDLVTAAHSSLLLGMLGPLLRGAAAANGPRTISYSEFTVAATKSLDRMLEDCLPALLKGGITRPNRCEMEVQLGLGYSRVGVLLLTPDADGIAATRMGEALTTAWVRQTWAIDPQSQIIRWQALENPRRILVSCIDRDTFGVLERFARQHGLKFVSCLPAILHAVENGQLERTDADAALASSSALTTVAWTEGSATGARENTVQLLGLRNGEIHAAWRGWLPSTVVTDGSDNEIRGAVRRFQACHGIATESLVHFRQWPFAADKLSTVGDAVHA